MGRRASAGEGRRSGGGSIQLHPSAGEGWTVAHRAVATDRTGGGGSGGRWKTVGLTDRVGPPVNEGGGDGTTGPEKEGGGGPRLGWKRREEAGPKLLLGLKSKRVKQKLILIDFWIKIGLEIE
jgi:hypothetical protein